MNFDLSLISKIKPAGGGTLVSSIIGRKMASDVAGVFLSQHHEQPLLFGRGSGRVRP